jgi:two-component system LytT family response regulator
MFFTILPKTNYMYSAVIIDDEEDGINVLKQLLKNFTLLNIKVVGVATNLKQGVQLIKQNEPEIVFLDIDMPNENGIAIFNYLLQHTNNMQLMH